MSITPEACAPQNVERLIAALEKAEFLLQQERAAHEKTRRMVYCAIDSRYTDSQSPPFSSWAETLDYITQAAARMRSPLATESDLARLRKNSDSDTALLEKRQRQIVAYSGVVYALKGMALLSDPKIIRFSGDDLLLVINQLDNNPDV